RVLAYREELFVASPQSERADADQMLNFFITKCALNLKRTLKPEQVDDIHFHNHHLPQGALQIPRGMLLTTKSKLPPGKFLAISEDSLIKKKPKEWIKNLNQSCSTR